MAAKTEKDQEEQLDRREFFSWFWIGWISFSMAIGGLLSLFGRFLFPNVLFEKPSTFRAGKIEDYQMGVDERFKDSQSVWIVKDDEGIFALSTVCTHLGCTPNWQTGDKKFKCPCHGSGYRISGLNFEGPAPRPLERFFIALDENGFIMVDKSKAIRQSHEWGKADFRLKI